MEQYLTLKDGREVLREDYINAKLGDLREFGYKSLMFQDISEQIDKLFTGEKLSVIGSFIKDDLKL